MPGTPTPSTLAEQMLTQILSAVNDLTRAQNKSNVDIAEVKGTVAGFNGAVQRLEATISAMQTKLETAAEHAKDAYLLLTDTGGVKDRVAQLEKRCDDMNAKIIVDGINQFDQQQKDLAKLTIALDGIPASVKAHNQFFDRWGWLATKTGAIIGFIGLGGATALFGWIIGTFGPSVPKQNAVALDEVNTSIQQLKSHEGLQ